MNMNKNNWISTRSKLPERYNRVLVWAPTYHDEPFIAFFDKKGIFTDTEFENDEQMLFTVKFWMPLPEPPKQLTNG
jgi:hypothetical protein